MTPVVVVMTGWLFFGGSHLLLSAPVLRDVLSNRLGTYRFVVIYILVTTVSLSLLIAAVACYGGDGASGLNLAAIPVARWILGAIALVGALLATAGIVNYSRSPMAVLARRWRERHDDEESKPLGVPAAVEHITRHPFFVGLAVLMFAHALLASTLAMAAYFTGFVLLALVGIPMQDRKLRERHGDVYGSYLSNTSAVPFAVTGRLPETLQPILLRSIAGTLVLGALHPLWQLGNGAFFAAAILMGGLFAVTKQLRQKHTGKTGSDLDSE